MKGFDSVSLNLCDAQPLSESTSKLLDQSVGRWFVPQAQRVVECFLEEEFAEIFKDLEEILRAHAGFLGGDLSALGGFFSAR